MIEQNVTDGKIGRTVYKGTLKNNKKLRHTASVIQYRNIYMKVINKQISNSS